MSFSQARGNEKAIPFPRKRANAQTSKSHKKPTHLDRSKKNAHHKSIKIGKPMANWILSTGALDVILASLVAKTIQ